MSLYVFLRRVLVSSFLPFLLLTTLLPAYAQEALLKELNAAEVYRAQGKYAAAEPLYQRALLKMEKALGPNHPLVAAVLNNLATLYQAQGRYAEAEPLYQRALSIYEKALRPDHPQVATTLENMAYLYKKTGRWDEAYKLEERAQAIRSRNQ
jgi:tetratricopeptide (TPR) repeat protein